MPASFGWNCGNDETIKLRVFFGRVSHGHSQKIVWGKTDGLDARNEDESLGPRESDEGQSRDLRNPVRCTAGDSVDPAEQDWPPQTRLRRLAGTTPYHTVRATRPRRSLCEELIPIRTLQIFSSHAL
ncbi:hypothetical protein GcC1_187006 [Golovinomyces cichoracearum]|uniref:Uncharacterized protein n=1 Tax=Golovinomyces cichoracearum TaxID=62708 RepID=A0A420HK56_9PEZI|nr:hypothetical protein GcC1_187006 [Golovinomyces cichoracearum]